ncbi:hypothetical protein D3C79_1111680 [compost metagenome]
MLVEGKPYVDTYQDKQTLKVIPVMRLRVDFVELLSPKEKDNDNTSTDQEDGAPF